MGNRQIKRRVFLVLSAFFLLLLLLIGVYHQFVSRMLEQRTQDNILLYKNNLLTQIESEFANLTQIASHLSVSPEIKAFLRAEDIDAFYTLANAASDSIRNTMYPEAVADGIIAFNAGGDYFRFIGGMSNSACETLLASYRAGGTLAYSVTVLDDTPFFCHIADVEGENGGPSPGSIAVLSGLSKTRRALGAGDGTSAVHAMLMLDGDILLASDPALETLPPAELEQQYSVETSAVPGTRLTVAMATDRDILRSSNRMFLVVSLVLLAFVALTVVLLFRSLSSYAITPLVSRTEKMEMGMLSMQMDAHFLRNTLTGIEQLSMRGEAEKAAQMASGLTALLKHIHTNPDLVNIFLEMEALEQYIHIMEAHVSTPFAVDFDVEDSLSAYKMPGQLLQPVVENAIRHGLSGRGPGGEITVTGALEHGDVRLCVRDNGRGMDALPLAALRKKISSVTGEESIAQGLHGVALLNVQKRIRLAFGDGYGLHVESAPDGGTSVSIILPGIPEV